MPPSTWFASLEKRLDVLREHLLPPEFSKDGRYREEEIDYAKGYRLLVHAEIEAYLEARCKEVIVSALTNWKKKSLASVPILSLLVHWNAGWPKGRDEDLTFDSLPVKDELKNISDGLNQAAKEYFRHLKQNHGIKESNLHLLLLPIGINFPDLDQTWIALMNSYGETRGLIAHGSSEATKEINPQDELNDVQDLRAGLRSLDKMLSALILKEEVEIGTTFTNVPTTSPGEERENV